jgi:hypothetical protein
VTVAPPSSVRSPLAVRASAVLLVLLAAVSMFGLVMFSFVWSDHGVGVGAVFSVVALAAAATAVAAVPSLLRGGLTGWAVPFVWACCYTYWSFYKVFAEEEFESAGLLVAGLALVALLSTRGARVHAGIAR